MKVVKIDLQEEHHKAIVKKQKDLIEQAKKMRKRIRSK